LGDREIFQISDCGVRIAEFKKQDKEMEAMLPPTSGLRRTSLPGGRQGVRRSKWGTRSAEYTITQFELTLPTHSKEHVA
jgi:hypothetical protein